MQEFSSIANQSVYDIVLQTYGDLNFTYKLIQDSNFSNLLIYPVIETLFKFNPTQVIDNIFSNYLVNNGLIINTASNKSSSYIVFSEEDEKTIFTNEDGTGYFIPE